MVPIALVILKVCESDFNRSYFCWNTFQKSIEDLLIILNESFYTFTVSSFRILTVNDQFEHFSIGLGDSFCFSIKLLKITLKDHRLDGIFGQIVQTAFEMLTSKFISINYISHLID